MAVFFLQLYPTTLFNININNIVKCPDSKTDGSLRVGDFGICYRSKNMSTIERHLQQCINRIYNKRDDFDFDIVNFPFLDGDGPCSAVYGVYSSQLIRFARGSSHVDDFNTRNKVLTTTLLRRGYRYHKLRKAFSKFYRRHFDIVFKYNVGLKTLLLQDLSEPEFYGDFVYKFRKIIGKNDFPYHFKKIIVRYKKIGYNTNVVRQTAFLVVNPIKVNSCAYLFNCMTADRTSD